MYALQFAVEIQYTLGEFKGGYGGGGGEAVERVKKGRMGSGRGRIG